MKRHMEEMTVSTLNGDDIRIEQRRAGYVSCVVISADQVPLMIQWLNEAAEAAECVPDGAGKIEPQKEKGL
jgi:hypothetical protein